MKGFQQTLKNKISITGQALHCGKDVSVHLIPQPVDTGVLFGRTDLPGKPVLKAVPTNVVDTLRSMTLGTNEWRIQTIEHLMAALHGLKVDNLLVEVDGPELPLGDGSALYFVEKILEAGLVTQDKPRKVRKITSPVAVIDEREPHSYLIALPGKGLRLSYYFTSDHKVTGNQFAQYLISPENFQQEIAPARTIAFYRELEALRQQGLALGGNMDIAVVVGEDSYLNTLRFEDEIVRHKILDLLGDLYLLGPIEGEIIGLRSGHKLDLELALKLESHLE
ncbi:MAG: UDP-3-O-[3-hydroxymyristoyl] N-acetylglucosamine deacetylase [Firmicutes bacterium]|nr:UDP-3-O-[3-hydroxymyristoyl] N-acetylglucosamine deacetylase [Bacillota bacterium]